MSALATVEAAWLTVRCPCNRATLGEVRGSGGEVRRVCPKCRGWWVVDCSTGSVVPDLSRKPIDGASTYR